MELKLTKTMTEESQRSLLIKEAGLSFEFLSMVLLSEPHHTADLRSPGQAEAQMCLNPNA